MGEKIDQIACETFRINVVFTPLLAGIDKAKYTVRM